MKSALLVPSGLLEQSAQRELLVRLVKSAPSDQLVLREPQARLVQQGLLALLHL